MKVYTVNFCDIDVDGNEVEKCIGVFDAYEKAECYGYEIMDSCDTDDEEYPLFYISEFSVNEKPSRKVLNEKLCMAVHWDKWG